MSRVAVKHTEVFKFDELSQKAKDYACQQYAEDGMYHQWWEFVYEDAKTVFALCGIRIDDIRFRGFSSQGDGAHFEGAWYANDVKPGGVKDHCPIDTELHRIAEGFERIAEAFPHAAFQVKHRGHYEHKYCTDFTVEFHDDPIQEMEYDSLERKARQDVLSQVEKELIELARDAMEWIYDALEKEYEYLCSEEHVREMADANEWEFTANGEIY